MLISTCNAEVGMKNIDGVVWSIWYASIIFVLHFENNSITQIIYEIISFTYDKTC